MNRAAYRDAAIDILSTAGLRSWNSDRMDVKEVRGGAYVEVWVYVDAADVAVTTEPID